MGGPDPIYVIEAVCPMDNWTEEVYGPFTDPWLAIGCALHLKECNPFPNFRITQLIQEWN